MNGIGDMFTGGQCGVNGTMGGMNAQSTNPLKNFMGTMVSGDHQIANKCPFSNKISQDNDINMVMQGFEQSWDDSQQIAMEQMQKEQMLMEQAFAQAHIQDQAMMQEMMAKCPHMQEGWNQAEENQMQEQWADELAHEVNEQKLQEMEENFKEAEEKVNQELDMENPQAATTDLMQTMMSDPDPKFRNSKFLHFIQNINKGNFEIKDNELIKHKEEPLELLKNKEGVSIKQWTQSNITDEMDLLEEMDEAFQESAVVVDNNLNSESKLTEAYNEAEIITEKDTVKMQMMDKQWEKAENQVEAEIMEEKNAVEDQGLNAMETFWEKAMKNYNPEDPQMLEKLQTEWSSILDNWDKDEDALQKHWQVASDIEELQYQNLKQNYAFDKENPYKNELNPHRGYIEAISKGNTNKAILMLEEHLQRHETDANGWRLLGFLLQENDQDQKSCSALLQSIKHDPSDINSLLQLGISCTNI